MFLHLSLLYHYFFPRETFNEQLAKRGIDILNRRGIIKYKEHAIASLRNSAQGFWGRHVVLARFIRALAINCVIAWFIDKVIAPRKLPVAQMVRRIFACAAAIGCTFWLLAVFWLRIAWPAGIIAGIAFISLIFTNAYLASLGVNDRSTNFTKASSRWRTIPRHKLKRKIPPNAAALMNVAVAVPGAQTGLDVLDEDPLIWVKPSGLFARKRYIGYFDAPGIEDFL